MRAIAIGGKHLREGGRHFRCRHPTSSTANFNEVSVRLDRDARPEGAHAKENPRALSQLDHDALGALERAARDAAMLSGNQLGIEPDIQFVEHCFLHGFNLGHEPALIDDIDDLAKPVR
jgi:hypothetical protein